MVNFTWKCRGLRTELVNKARKLRLPDIKTHYKVIVGEDLLAPKREKQSNRNGYRV